MPTRVYLVRHGATTLTAEDRFAGSSDVTLSDEGRRQVASLAERLKNERLDAIYASCPLARTVETARILAAPHDLTPIPDPGLREIDYGHWEGLTRSEVECNYAEEYAIWQEDPFTIAPNGGESGVNVINRVLPVFRRIVEAHRHRIVLVVSHKGTNRLRAKPPSHLSPFQNNLLRVQMDKTRHIRYNSGDLGPTRVTICTFARSPYVPLMAPLTRRATRR